MMVVQVAVFVLFMMVMVVVIFNEGLVLSCILVLVLLGEEFEGLVRLKGVLWSQVHVDRDIFHLVAPHQRVDFILDLVSVAVLQHF